MESHPPSQASVSQAKGFAAIALASAAGVIVASCVKRPALVVAAGLALSWWRHRASHPAPPRETPGPSNGTPASDHDLQDEVERLETLHQADLGQPATSTTPSTSPPSAPFPEAPRRNIEPPLNAWDDLRAAISPVAGKALSSGSLPRPMPDLEVGGEPFLEQVSLMPGFSISVPSSPWLIGDDHDDQLPEVTSTPPASDWKTSDINPNDAAASSTIWINDAPDVGHPLMDVTLQESAGEEPSLLSGPTMALEVAGPAETTPPDPKVTISDPVPSPVTTDVPPKKTFFEWLRS